MLRLRQHGGSGLMSGIGCRAQPLESARRRLGINDVSPWQDSFPYASWRSIGGSLLAFIVRIGYPKALTAFFEQGLA